MNIKKSFVLTPALPSSSHDPSLFEKALIFLKERNISTIEYFVDFDLAECFQPLLSKHGFSGIYLAAAYQKKNNLNLCAIDEADQARAIQETINCYHAAIKSGASGMLITSGRYSGHSQETLSWQNLKASILKLLAFSSHDFFITMEPGDQNVDACQLAGPSDITIPFAQSIHNDYNNFWLTMDTSHLAQLGEDPIPSVVAAKNCCKHIHLANCILKPNHLLYGDKHPLFSHPDAVYSLGDIKKMANMFSNTFSDGLTISIEIINREKNEWAGFMSILNEEDWFFNF